MTETVFRLRCADAGASCTLVLLGSRDQVLAEGAAHWRRAHGARGSDGEIRDAVAEIMREDTLGFNWPSDPAAAAGNPDWPF